MKKFRRLTAWFVAFVMLMTFIPTFSLTASAADATAKITGVVVKVNGTEQPVGVLNIKDGDIVEVVYQGENFDKLTSNHKYKVGANGGSLKSSSVEVDTTVIPNTATRTYSASVLNSSTWKTISYTNAGESETVSGYTINYNNQNDQVEATPKITGVKVLINNVEQPAGEIAIADSDEVTIIYSGENFEELGLNNQDYKYRIGTGTGNFYWFTIDTTATPHTATNTYTGSSVRSGSIGYTNKGEAEVIVYTINNDNQNDQPEVEATPKITGVKVLINNVEQPAGEIAIADSDEVTIIYSGENFEELGLNNQDYKYRIGPYSGNFYSFTIDTTVTPHTATKTYTGSSINYKETIAYTNKGESETVTGYIMKEPAPTTYTVTVSDAIENGTVVTDVSKAAEGDTVTLTVTPNEGYALKTLTVGGKDVTENVTDNAYTFEMPAAEVVVTATFAEVYSVTRSVYAGYTINKTADTVLPIKHGDSYAFTLEITSGYEKTAEFAVKAGTGEDDASELTVLTPDENGVYTIANITTDIKIQVVGVSPYKPDSVDDFKAGGNYPVKLVCEADDSHSITAPYFDSAYVTVGEINATTRLCETTFNVAKYMADKLPGHRAAGNIPDNITLWLKWDAEARKWAYTSATRELTVTCAPETYIVRINPTTNGTVTADKAEAAEGETVRLSVTPDEGYELKSIIAWQNGTKLEIGDDNTFTMPAANVIISVIFAACDHTDSKHETASNCGDGEHSFLCTVCGTTGTEEHSPNYFANGSTITATCSKNCGYSGTATISAIGKIYDGTALEATVEATGDLAGSTIAITYAVKRGAKLESAPVDAGDYTASITLGKGENAATASVDFTITPSHTHSLGYKYSDTEHWQECTAADCPDKESTITNLAAHNFDYDCDTDCNDSCGYTRTTSHSPLADLIAGDNGHWYDCEFCGEDLDFAGHNYKTEWSYDTEWHWYECDECGYRDGLVEHSYDSDTDTTCNCGHTRTIDNDDDDTSDTPVITSLTFNSDSPAYNSESNTFTVTKDSPFVVYITGEHFENIDNTFLEETSFGFVASVDDSENALGNSLYVFKEAGLVTVNAGENTIALTFNYDAMKAFIAEHGGFEGICYGDIANINEENINPVNIALAKYDPIYTEPTVKTGLVYNGAEQELLIPGTAEGGTMKYYIGGTEATAEVPTRKAAGEYTVTCIIVGDSFHNNIVVGTYTVTIAKKTIDSAIALTAPVKNAAPQTEIAGSGYTATVTWSPEVTDKFGYNTEYTATVTITPDENHTVTGIAANGYTVEGAKTVTNDENSNVIIVAYEKTGSRPSSGGGGGSSSNTTTTTTKNEDGSTTKVTENKATGTKTEVTTNTDGSTTTVETKKDGTVTTTEKDSEGNKTVTTEKADGSTTTEETRKDGTEVKTNTTADGETTAEIKADGKAEVTIPVADTENVQMLVVTDENGDNTYITDFETSEGGVAVTTEGNASVRVVSGDKKEFVDVHHVDHWSEKSVDFVYLLGLMNGTGEHHFSPDEHLTRAMLVAVLYRAEGEPAVENDKSFEDVEGGSYYEKAVAWAKANGIVNGTSDTTFEPDAEITREQIAAIMHRYAQYKGIDVSVGEETNILSYEDYDSISEYAIASMQWVVGSGLIKGKTETTLNPLDNATRAEAATILERFIKAN